MTSNGQLTDEQYRVLASLIKGTFDGTEPSVILSLVNRGFIASEDGAIVVTHEGIAAYQARKQQGS
jgi:hypothetical protein